MKTIKKTMYLVMLFTSVLFTACNSDDDNGGDGGTSGAEFFTATVAGSSFEASTDPASLIGAGLSTNNGITIATAQGSTNNGVFINFSIINYDGPGTYTTGDNLTNTNGIMYGEFSDIWASNGVTSIVGGLQAGEIVITSDSDGVLEGTFSFEGYNAETETSKMVASGSFKANIE